MGILELIRNSRSEEEKKSENEYSAVLHWCQEQYAITHKDLPAGAKGLNDKLLSLILEMNWAEKQEREVASLVGQN